MTRWRCRDCSAPPSMPAAARWPREQLERVLESAYALIEELVDEAKPDPPSDRGLASANAALSCALRAADHWTRPRRECSHSFWANAGIGARAVPHSGSIALGDCRRCNRAIPACCACAIWIWKAASRTFAICCAGCAGCCRTCRCWWGFGRRTRRPLQDERMRAAIGADHYVTSLQEAVRGVRLRWCGPRRPP